MDHFNYLTSCSLETNTLPALFSAEMVMRGYGLQGVPGTYSTKAFFREGSPTPDMTYGFLLQSVAFKYGKGRVLAFTDSTCFSNYCVFMDGYPAYLLGSMDYLNRTNKTDYLNNIFIALAIISLILTLFFFRKERKVMAILIIISVGTLSYGASVATFSYLNEVNYTLPDPHSHIPTICFVENYSDFAISSRPVWDESLQIKKFNTFFIWTQRVDLVPSIENLYHAIDKGDAIVIINPVKSFGEKEVDNITSYVEKGGKLLLMDGVLNTDSTANDLLQYFGIWINRDSDNYKNLSEYNDTNSSINNSTTIGNVTTPSLTILGGEQLFVTEENETSIAIVEYGDGKIVVVVDSYTFTDVVMGGSFTEPDETLREIYNTEYYILEEILFNEN
jgi:hypothetical protein